ncbi:hypothetical protein [Methylobacterium nigriterrae]
MADPALKPDEHSASASASQGRMRYEATSTNVLMPGTTSSTVRSTSIR